MQIGGKKRTVEKLLDVDAEMTGNLVFKDPVNLRINGKFEGTLETKGNLIIGETAVVSAQITGEDVIIAGKVKGKIVALRLSLLSTAKVEGEIRTNKLIISEGALFEGVSHMVSDYLSIEELAHYLEVNTSNILEWVDSGKIPANREGDSLRFERKTIDEWIVKELYRAPK